MVLQARVGSRGLLRPIVIVSRSSTLKYRSIPIARLSTTQVQRGPFEAGENKTGHINTKQDEGIFFFDSVFPLRLQWLLRLPFSGEKSVPRILQRIKLADIATDDPTNILSQASSTDQKVTVTEILPRLKEGGAFVKFTHSPDVSKADIATSVDKFLREKAIKPWWNPFAQIRSSLVKGRPWVEDLYRMPTDRLRIEFLPPKPGDEPAELSQEMLYEFFRPYGKLSDIVPQASDSKVLPKFAYLDFAQRRKAIMARNCMHGYVVTEAEGGGKAGTLLKLTYEKRAKAHWIRDWILNHPRIVIPALAALLAAISFVVFDPVRTFFVKAHVTRHFKFSDNKVVKWFKAKTTQILSLQKSKDEEPGMEAIWDDRKGNIDQIKTWLMETADTFIIVQGPRGSGKRELVIDQALKDKKNTLVIDCKPIQEARGDSATINAMAMEVGYRPVFSWMNSISGLLDLAAQGAAGIKTGFSETLDTQLTKIMTTTSTALKQIALSHRHKDDKDSGEEDDEWLEAHPDQRPVVVIDNFMYKSHERQVVYDRIAEWAAQLTVSNIAHVIFLTNDLSFTKSLSKALPDRVFRQISLSDCSPEVAKRYVISHLDSDPDDFVASERDPEKKIPPSQRRTDLSELDECISYLGGRLTDLEFLARRIKTGETPKKAVKEIIEQSASEVLKLHIFGTDESRSWNSEQAWLLIKQLANHDMLRYNEVLLSDIYKSGGEKALQALEQAELISIVATNGRPHSIKPGKPVYQPAFRQLVRDAVLRSRMDMAILGEQVKVESATIDKCENELHLLSELKKQPTELAARVQYLLDKVATSQSKIELYEKEQGELKKILQSQY